MSQKAKNEILKVVTNITKTVPGGEKFFDILDEFLCSIDAEWIITAALRSVPRSHTLILSGGMGKRIADGIDSGIFPNRSYVLFKGSVRKTGHVEMIRFSGEIQSKSTFFDDSIYGGVTFFKIKEWIETDGRFPAPEFVYAIYDGCPDKRDFVKSMFRYYDFFQATPNFQF